MSTNILGRPVGEETIQQTLIPTYCVETNYAIHEISLIAHQIQIEFRTAFHKIHLTNILTK